jgi:hypothetical protein
LEHSENTKATYIKQDLLSAVKHLLNHAQYEIGQRPE